MSVSHKGVIPGKGEGKTISADFPYKSNYIEVHGSRIMFGKGGKYAKDNAMPLVQR